MYVCALSDMHLNVGNSVVQIQNMVELCDLVVYVGDILDFEAIVDCKSWGPDCNAALGYLDIVLDDIGKPFLFTLGNHDSVPVHTSDIAMHIAHHELHNATCNPSASACYITNPNIATLYSGSYKCPYASNSYYGCPQPEDANFLNQLDKIDMLITHIPPPDAFELPFVGIQEDCACYSCICGWKQTDRTVLPNVPTDWHGSGHHHNSLFTTTSSIGTKYTNLLKTGPNGFGPSFFDDIGGMSVFYWDNNDITFDRYELINGSTFNIEAK